MLNNTKLYFSSIDLFSMKVLILGSKEYPMGTNQGDDPIPSGGMETYVQDLAPELSKHCKVVIITRKFKRTKRYEILGNVEVYRVPWIKGKYFRNPSFNFVSFFVSLVLIPSKGIDIIYSHGLISTVFGLILSRIWGKPLIGRPAGFSTSQYPFPVNKILWRLNRLVFPKCKKIVFHSEGELKGFEREFGVKLRNGAVILTGFPVDKFLVKDKELKRELGIKGKKVVTFVGRFVPVKGLPYLLEAFALLKRKDTVLLLVGDGPEKENLKKLVERLGLKDKVIFTGFRLDTERFYSVTDVFVISSESEGLPTSLLEAMAAKNACVVTDIGLPVKNMETGIVVPPKNPEAIAEGIRILLENPKLREKIGKKAREFVERNCYPWIAAKKHMEVFREVSAES
ncbi:MAG: hypothetical protein DRP13_02695 [Candidatus Aenigmatarchaeota archaeon]|nr:MAG: hypothetical protein DRP13_02695 [Candidatus Aenigmarchaeota archaeon]